MQKFVDFHIAAAAKANAFSQWEKARDRLVDGCWPEIQPSFTLPRGAKVFTLGSCFARNIEEHLARLGFEIPMLRFRVPATEFPARPNGILNKYTPASIHQELRWTADIEDAGGTVTPADCEKFCYRLENGQVIDNGLSGFVPVSYERFLERRREIFEVVRHAFSSHCVAITPGLTEAWFDTSLGLYIQKAPVNRHLASYQARVKFVQMDFKTCYRYLQQSIDLIRARHPETKFLITTSPVPLARTFTTQDVIVANTHAKSVLRAACGEIAANNPGVDYFPSYESVMLTRDVKVFEGDLLHVDEAFIGKIVARLATTYFSAAPEAERSFQGSFATAQSSTPDGLRHAIALARRACELEPGRDDFAIRLADLLGQSGDLAQSRSILEEILHRDPGSLAPLKVLASIQEKTGDRESAIGSLRRAIAIDPNDADSLARLGGLLNEISDSKSAFDVLSRALEINPSCAEAHFQMAKLHDQCGHRAAAMVAIAKSARLDPHEPRYSALLESIANGRAGSPPRHPGASNPGLRYYASLAKETAKRLLKSLRPSTP